MNLTKDPAPWGISKNDSLRDRVKAYIEAMNQTDTDAGQSLEDTTELLDSAMKVIILA